MRHRVIETPTGKVNLGRELFWDIHQDNISAALARSPEWVVVRVFEYGTLDEIFEIINFYGKEHVKDILLKAQLKPVAKAMAWVYLDLDL